MRPDVVQVASAAPSPAEKYIFKRSGKTVAMLALPFEDSAFLAYFLFRPQEMPAPEACGSLYSSLFKE